MSGKSVRVATAIIIAIILFGIGAAVYLIQTSSESFESRTISHNTNLNPNLRYEYAGGLTVQSSETQSVRPPDLHFEISVVDSGNDIVTVSIHYAVYDTDLVTFKSLNESSREEYLVDSGVGAESVDGSIQLQNHASVYSWVFWFEADSKTDAWSVDVRLTLRYNWGLP
ncbi:MAG: hypothetical protein ACFFB7_07990 [Candidatus Sifarchaeia archaeon]